MIATVASDAYAMKMVIYFIGVHDTFLSISSIQ